MSDNEIRHECGHTDADHKDQLAAILSEIFGMPEDVARMAAETLEEVTYDNGGPAVDTMADIVTYDVLYAVTRPTMDQDIRSTTVAIGKTSNHITSVADIPKIIAIKLGVPVEWVSVLDSRAVSSRNL
jgi:hypothetical protein